MGSVLLLGRVTYRPALEMDSPVTTHPPWVPSRAGRGGPPTHPWLLHYAPEVSDWSGYERGSFFVIPLRLGRLCNWIQFLLCDATIATLRPDNWQCEVHGHRKHASLHVCVGLCIDWEKFVCTCSSARQNRFESTGALGAARWGDHPPTPRPHLPYPREATHPPWPQNQFVGR